MTGIGGDCFVLYTRPGEPDVRALNGSGRAPAAASAAALRAAGHATLPADSVHTVTVPGAVDAFCRLAENDGRLGLDALLAPAIHYAEEGVPVAPRVAFDWQQDAHVLKGAARDAYLIDGAVPCQGQVFRAPRQAEVLRRIARNGRAGFYEGEVAEDMRATLTALGGLHTAEDFATVCATEADPIAGDYGNVTLYEHPPNGQGAAAILMLNILRRFDLAAMDPLGADRAHIEAEAAKLAYDARDRFSADAGHTARLDHMLAEDTADALAALIDPACAMPAAAPLAETVHKDTIYITVVDRDRMAVSLIYSIYNGFGAGIASDRFGILFHNRGAGFTLQEGHPNELAGGKRPMHTIIPAMLGAGGRITMPFGVMGGAYQPNGHARVVSNLVDFGMDPQIALDAPRAFSDSGTMKVERGYTDAVRRDLADRGHDVVVPDTPIGGAQAIRIHDSGVLEGASDPRKDGCALGY
jgi:gamma-glutamyltranspeptidase/glutathione hydrolase